MVSPQCIIEYDQVAVEKFHHLGKQWEESATPKLKNQS